MKAFSAVARTLLLSRLREPVGFFFSIVFAPALVLVLGLVFGNDPNPDFGGHGYIDETLPAFGSVVLAIIGVLILPVNQLTLRESGALRRLQLTPLRSSTFIAADLAVTFVVGLIGIIAAFAVGWAAFGVALPSKPFAVLLAITLGLAAFLALGYTLAALYSSSAAATGIGNVLMIILMLSSGAFVPLETLPDGPRHIMELSPVRHFVILTEGLWDGEPFSDLWLPVTVLAGMLITCGALASHLFRWETA